MSALLSGRVILVTRPADQCARLAQLIREAGGEALLFPALEIEPLPAAQLPTGPGSAPVELLIFVSPNAVRIGLPVMLRHGGIGERVKVAAVGPGTAAQLKRNGIENIISPHSGFDSEALLEALSGMDLAGVRVRIVRGQGGREFLAQHLRARGAAVDYLECYRAARPHRDLRELRGLDAIGACIATSSAIVENLFEMAGATAWAWLRALPFFVPHARVAHTAYARGVQVVFVAGAGDECLVTGLQTWFNRLRVANVTP